MSDQLFECGKCGQLTHLITGKTWMENEIIHEYAECEHCHKKTTIFYSGKEIRSLLIKQKNTKPSKYRAKLAAEIQNKMDKLKQEME
ncbi:hypothetical protein [Enterococcus viikkiensis]|uniref:hypothetical protein n=1 Tax=Enterococcus viikkiensis TaxID=930854 RepID=UPI0010F56065|nr:hypothetical protein [Enterococcus viikkiensis]